MVCGCHAVVSVLSDEFVKPSVTKQPCGLFNGAFAADSFSAGVEAPDVAGDAAPGGFLFYEGFVELALFAPQTEIAVGYGKVEAEEVTKCMGCGQQCHGVGSAGYGKEQPVTWLEQLSEPDVVQDAFFEQMHALVRMMDLLLL